MRKTINRGRKQSGAGQSMKSLMGWVLIKSQGTGDAGAAKPLVQGTV